MQPAELLDSVKQVTGSDGKTARTLGIAPNVISEWRRGKRSCTIETRIKLAALAGIDPRDVLEPYIEETLKGTPWLEAGMRAMGKALAGVVATTCIWGSAPGDARAADAETASTTMYILLIAALYSIALLYH